MKILIIDDNADLGKPMKRLIEIAGPQCEWADGGEAGIAAVAAAPPDLIFLDVMMPGMNGFDVLKHLRSTGFTKPIIMLTCLDDDESIRQARALGADAYMVKASFGDSGISNIIKRFYPLLDQETECQQQSS